MKTNKLLIMGLILSGLILSSCGATQGSSQASKDESESSIIEPISTDSSSDDPNSEFSNLSSSDEPDVTYLSVTEAVALANQVGEQGTQERQYVTGKVKNITNSTYGEMYITDGASDLYIYGVYSSDGALRYSEMSEKPYSGDDV